MSQNLKTFDFFVTFSYCRSLFIFEEGKFIMANFVKEQQVEIVEF